MALPKLPKEIYVTRDLNSDDLKGLLAWSCMVDAAEDDEQVVGVYQLVATKRVKKVVSVK